MNNENDDNAQSTSGIAKFVPAVVLVSAIIGFVSLAWYAYHTGRQSMKEDDLLVIEAEKTPIKEKPLDPGGMKFPNQDKTIFETFSGNQTPAKVERVLPAGEEPMEKSKAIDAAIEQKSASVKEAPLEVKKIEAVGVNDKKPVAPVVTKIAETKKSEKPTAEKSVEKAPVKSGGAKVQLGAYGSEKEAKETWEKLQKKISALSEHSPIIVRADVKGKIFYRLRVTGFADKNAAKSFCNTVSAKGQACILASE